MLNRLNNCCSGVKVPWTSLLNEKRALLTGRLRQDSRITIDQLPLTKLCD